jgi:hypothetical protein
MPCEEAPNLNLRVMSRRFEGQRPSLCVIHKQPGMVDVISKRCAVEGCYTQPSYGAPGQKGASHCAKHKQPGQVNVVSKRCQGEGCDRIPVYGMTGQRPTHCSKHKTAEMVNVAHRRCEEPGCSVQPSFGFEDGKGASPSSCCCHHG